MQENRKLTFILTFSTNWFVIDIYYYRTLSFRFDHVTNIFQKMISARCVFSWRRTFDGIRGVYLAARNERTQKKKKKKESGKNEKRDRRCGRKGRKMCRWRWVEDDRSSDHRAFDLQRRNFIISDTRVSSPSSKGLKNEGRPNTCSERTGTGVDRCRASRGKTLPFSSTFILSATEIYHSHFRYGRTFKVERTRFYSRCLFCGLLIEFGAAVSC